MTEIDEVMIAPKIVQMMPADGWYAFFKDEDGGMDYEPLVCFALTSNAEGETEIRPMSWQDGFVDFCDEYDNFEGIEKIDLSDDDFDIEMDEEIIAADDEEVPSKD
jgi:hypothetical protein